MTQVLQINRIASKAYAISESEHENEDKSEKENISHYSFPLCSR